MYTNRDNNIGCITVIILWTFIILLFVGLSFWTDRTLDFWCSYFSGHTINVPMWLSSLLSIVLNGVIVTINIISEIIRFCL